MDVCALPWDHSSCTQTDVVPSGRASTISRAIHFDRAAYRERNRVERLFAKLKEFRRVAPRYEKL
jgi:transposase